MIRLTRATGFSWAFPFALVSLLFFIPFSSATTVDQQGPEEYQALKAGIIKRYANIAPKEWGERATGVKTRIATREKLIALTFDACGSAKGMGFDDALIDFLENEKVPATLFINSRWIAPNQAAFDRLAANSLFEIANHGFEHKPASVNGKSVYGIQGAKSVEELVDEIELGGRKIEVATGRKPRFYRSGAAFYDEVAVKVANDLGTQVAGFTVLGDAGATYKAEQIKNAILSASPGDIIILHMNHPESGTAAGVATGVAELKRRGFRFVRLSDYPLE